MASIYAERKCPKCGSSDLDLETTLCHDDDNPSTVGNCSGCNRRDCVNDRLG